MGIAKNTLSLAGEYAVASELCKRGLYAQLTLGNFKSTDIVIFDANYENYIRIEVKSQQSGAWANIKGIKGENIFLVCVDFSERNNLKRPDFYIFNDEDWLNFVKRKYEKELLLDDNNRRKVIIDDNYVPCWINQKIKNSNSCFKGIDFKPKEIFNFQDKWDKITLLHN